MENTPRLTPSAIVRYLDQYVIGQDEAKQVVAVAVYAHYKKIEKSRRDRVDIGQYDTCLHRCRYCYANTNGRMAEASFADHHSDATILSGTLRGDETITARKVTHLKIQPTAESQMDSLF